MATFVSSVWLNETPLGSGVFLLLLWCYFWARYVCSRVEASKEVGSKTLEETLVGSDNLTIASMQRLRKLRQTQKGRMRPAFKQLAGRIAALDLRAARMRSVSSASDLFGYSSGAATASPPSAAARNLGLIPTTSRWDKAEQPNGARQLPTVASRVEQALASALPGAVRDAALFSSICGTAEQRQLATGGPPLEVCARGCPPLLSVVIVLGGTLEVSTDEGAVDGGISRYSSGQLVTSLLTTLCAVLGQPAPLPVCLRSVGGDPAQLLVLPTAAYAPLVLGHHAYLSLIVRETLGRLDTGLLEVAAHLGLAPSVLKAAPVAHHNWQVESAAGVSATLLELARTTVIDSLGVTASELPEIDVPAPYDICVKLYLCVSVCVCVCLCVSVCILHTVYVIRSSCSLAAGRAERWQRLILVANSCD